MVHFQKSGFNKSQLHVKCAVDILKEHSTYFTNVVQFSFSFCIIPDVSAYKLCLGFERIGYSGYKGAFMKVIIDLHYGKCRAQVTISRPELL